MTKSIEDLRIEIVNLKNQLGTWQKVGDYYDVGKAVVWRIVNNHYEPKNNLIRHKLGLIQIIIQEIARNPKGQFESMKKDGQ